LDNALHARTRSERAVASLFAHQAWSWKFAGFHWVETIDITAVVDALVEGTAVTLDRHRLARQVREELYARHCLIPRDRDIGDWVRRAIQLVENEDRRYLDGKAILRSEPARFKTSGSLTDRRPSRR
jgi:hypothetical protein